MKKIFLIFTFFFLLLSNHAWSVTKYDIEVAFIYKFLQFIEWPRLDKENFYICFIGDSQIEESMNSLEDKKYKNRKIKVEKFSSIEESKSCNVLYIDNKGHDSEKLKEIFASKSLFANRDSAS